MSETTNGDTASHSGNGTHANGNRAHAPQTAHDTASFPIAIIGAGFAGIGMAIQLKQAGILSFTIFERAGEVGGTWRDNTYPGAACDVPSHVYSFSFEQNPEWTRAYATSDEIQAYLLRCVDKYRLRAHLRFNTAITRAVFDDRRGLWTLTTSTGETITARAVVSGMGGLVDPSYPNIAGIDSFRGERIHTARWNHDYDLAGKRVAVIGTGASAVQVVPSIAAKVSKLTVFQRTPAWVMPKMDKAVTEQRKHRYRLYPQLLRLKRWMLFWVSELMGPMIMLDSPRISRIGERWSLKHLERSVKSPELRAKLTPDYQFGCKRVLISDDYWPALERDNVELVTDSIVEIRDGGIATADGRLHEVDAIVFATGFSVSIIAAPFHISGLGGRTMADAWERGAVAYKGVSVSGIPNWFILMGPNTGPGHTSVLVYTEAEIRYVVQAIKKLIAGDLKYIDVKKAVQDRYNAAIQRRMKHMVWASGCKSWYLSPDGSNHSLFPGFASEFVLRARRFRLDDYEAAALDDARTPAPVSADPSPRSRTEPSAPALRAETDPRACSDPAPETVH